PRPPRSPPLPYTTLFRSLAYNTSSPRRGAYQFGQVDLQVFRRDGWWRRQLRLNLPHNVAVFPNVVAIKRVQLSLRRGLRSLVGQDRKSTRLNSSHQIISY